jgi:hypothetical protein
MVASVALEHVLRWVFRNPGWAELDDWGRVHPDGMTTATRPDNPDEVGVV